VKNTVDESIKYYSDNIISKCGSPLIKIVPNELLE
jgi:hypothetical protein